MTSTAPKYTSHFGVYALIFNETKDSILLIKKVLGCYKGLHDLPGGSPEPHEHLHETLVREVFEETGCYVTDSTQLGAFSALFPFIETNGEPMTMRHMAAIYVATIAGNPIGYIEKNSNNSSGCVWMPLKDITAANTVPLARLAVEALNSANKKVA